MRGSVESNCENDALGAGLHVSSALATILLDQKEPIPSPSSATHYLQHLHPFQKLPTFTRRLLLDRMPRIPYRYPEPGVDAIADRIRARRGERGLTPLDGTLLNAPDVADGWNTFVGGLRQRTSLRDDVRELMVSLKRRKADDDSIAVGGGGEVGGDASISTAMLLVGLMSADGDDGDGD